MNDWLSNISGNPYFNLLSIIAGVIGVVTLPLSIYLYLRQKRERKPRFDHRSYEIIENLSSKITGIDVTYGGNSIPNLTITKIAFWNVGRETITTSDIPEKEPLGVRFDEGTEILDSSVVYQSTEANNFSITSAKGLNECEIGFDYIDCDDYVIFQILHSGGTANIDFAGRVKGVGRIQKSRLKNANDEFEKWFIGGLIIWGIVTLLSFPFLKTLFPETASALLVIFVWFCGGILIAKVARSFADRQRKWRDKFHKAF